MLMVALTALGCSDASSSWHVPQQAPATVTDVSRDTAQTNDFLRILFVPAGVVPTALGLPDALRVFATASAFFQPPLPAAQTADYPGLPYRADRDLVAMRCNPPDPARIDPVLASWPNTLTAITGDLAGRYTCPPASGSPENEVYCLAAGYNDVASQTVVLTLQSALAVGVSLFATPERTAVLQRRFGIFPAFSGLGFSVKGTGDGAPITAARALRQSIIPEYLLRNATLADAGCYCIIVPPYDGRDTAPLDVDYIVQHGGFGSCESVDRLARAGP